MSKEFRVGPLQDSAVLHIYSQKDAIQIDPPYQREGDVWTAEKQQLLIDSILNGFDIPKLYFHEFAPMKIVGKRKYKYAIVDGRQRLQAIWDFIENGFPLSEDFTYLHDDSIRAAGLTYSGLAEKYPTLKITFDSRTLPVTTIQTNDLDLIEEMFSRLNEAVPLNAPEKRNAWGGPIPQVVKDLVKHKFFAEIVKVTSKRYKHYDIATKFLLFEHAGNAVDTKKVYLDDFVRDFKEGDRVAANKLRDQCVQVMDAMVDKFSKKDLLLGSIGVLPLYYLLFQKALKENWYPKIQRTVFQKFDDAEKQNRLRAEKEMADADYELLEFGRLSQSPNDGVAIRFRLKVLTKFVRDALGLPKEKDNDQRLIPRKQKPAKN